MVFTDPWHTRPEGMPQQEKAADSTADASAAKPRKRRRLPAFLEGVIELVLDIAAEIIDALT